MTFPIGKRLDPIESSLRNTDLPSDPDYDYWPATPASRDASHYPTRIWTGIFNPCGGKFSFAVFHDCFELEDEEDFAVRIPRNKSKFGVETSDQSVGFVLGIQTQYSISFLYVALYHLIMMAGPIGFWIWWQKHHPEDLQNASIPVTTTAALISLLWSAMGIFKMPRGAQSA